MIKRIRNLLRRRHIARSYGISYSRSRDWRVPASFRVNGTEYPISCPQSGGTNVAFSDIYFDDVYGLRSLRHADVVVDVGANAGFFSMLARERFPHAIIHAYEPNPGMWTYLEHQARVWRLVVFKCAVGKESGRVNMGSEMDPTCKTTITASDGSVPMVSIREAIESAGGYVSLLKLDCEGAEWDILQDSEALGRVHQLRMEYHLIGGRTQEDVRQLIPDSFRIDLFMSDHAKVGRVWATNKHLNPRSAPPNLLT